MESVTTFIAFLGQFFFLLHLPINLPISARDEVVKSILNFIPIFIA